MSALILTGASDVSITVGAPITERRDEAVFSARMITEVDETTLNEAVVSIRELKALAAEVEASRVAVKRPVDAIARQIQETAKTFVAPVEVELQRLHGLVTQHERVKAEAARKKAAEEERQRQQAEREAREAAAKLERERLAAIAANQPPPPPPPPPPKPVVQPTFSLAPQPPKPKGLGGRREPAFRVVCETTLASEHPELVTITPRARDIMDRVRAMGPFDGERRIGNGLAVYWEDKTTIRI